MLGLITLFLSNCSWDLGIDFEEIPSKLVVNSVFFHGEPFQVRLTSSRNILDEGSKIEQVTGATVEIWNENDNLLERLEELNQSGLYYSQEIKAFKGFSYTLKVSHPEFGEGELYTATSSVPQISDETKLDTSTVSFSDGDALKIEAFIFDSEEDKETYIFEVELLDNEELATLISYDEDAVIYGDPESPQRLFLEDNSFNGLERDFNFFTYSGTLVDSTNTQSEIRMINASEELAKYYISLEKFELAQKTINPVSGAPVELYSNIKRGGDKLGFGVFAGANRRSIVIRN